MGEANTKPTTFDLQITTGERFLLSRLMSANTRCPDCKSGPVDTSEPLKLIRFGKLWDALNLVEFEEISQSELQNKLSEPNVSAITTINLSAELLRFLVEIVIGQSSVLFNFAAIARLLSALIAIAKEHKIKLVGYDAVSDNTDAKTIAFSNKEIDALLVTFFTSKKCETLMRTQTGETVPHGQAVDYPKTISEFITYNRLLEQLKLKDILAGTARFEPFEGTKDYALDLATINYMEDLVAKRSTITAYPPTKFIAIMNKLEEAKNKNETTN